MDLNSSVDPTDRLCRAHVARQYNDPQDLFHVAPCDGVVLSTAQATPDADAFEKTVPFIPAFVHLLQPEAALLLILRDL
jgi:hypothetical protein